MKKFTAAAAAMILASTSALGLNVTTRSSDDRRTRPNPNPRVRDNGTVSAKEHNRTVATRQVLRKEARQAKKASWNGTLREMRSRGRGSSTQRTRFRFSDELKGFSGAKLLRKAFNGELGRAAIR